MTPARREKRAYCSSSETLRTPVFFSAFKSFKASARLPTGRRCPTISLTVGIRHLRLIATGIQMPARHPAHSSTRQDIPVDQTMGGNHRPVTSNYTRPDGAIGTNHHVSPDVNQKSEKLIYRTFER